MSRRIAVYPDTRPDMYEACCEAVAKAGAATCDLAHANGLIFADANRPDLLAPTLQAHPHLAWVQLPYAGIEEFLEHLDHDRIWTNGKDVYSEPVAEHIMALMLTAFRDLHRYARSTSWSSHGGRNLLGAKVTVLGGGGITRSLLRLLHPWGCTITVVRRSDTPIEGADRVVTSDQLHNAVADADVVVIAMALTPETTGIVDESVLAAMPDHAWIVNVGRGGHIVTDHLITALTNGHIAGAALDVTDPEPLPDGHALWTLPNVIITPHVGNTREMGLPLLAARVQENVRRFCAGEDLLGVVDVDSGY